ncbi:MAG: translation initiation factor IF-2 N-terminal domain-containing protein, partial [Desulfovibrio sp.]|nr:translation initiation factor IF-2 N-terminal domain-containing protein [Desulfovibrio sp.]
MSDKKIKIKELACELKVSNPDMLKAALDEGISARNSAASVTPEEADRLRKHFDKLRSGDKSKEVIVRRRTGPRPPRGERGQGSRAGAQGRSAEAPEASPAELSAGQSAAEPAVQPAGQEAPAAPGKAPVQEAAPQAEAVQAPQPAPAAEVQSGQSDQSGQSGQDGAREDLKPSEERSREQAG